MNINPNIMSKYINKCENYECPTFKINLPKGRGNPSNFWYSWNLIILNISYASFNEDKKKNK